MTPLSQNLKKARKELKWTQAEAAEMIGTNRASIGAYEEGRAYPPLPVFLKICEVYGVLDYKDFVMNPDFSTSTYYNWANKQSVVDKKYRALKGAAKKAVNALLGIK